ncbi:alpha-L-arabinofuranosidase C-terminal domain-containing protein [Massilibacteroides sp.]|uniref:alpha-L-arabinofuranosidase C-terminal domain-containing protein n=1 Tax=Massilibacteroides sp. TaxID=2034766 RepID=UPI00262063D7|nr:alpha-L-arabinofuranosidase C-terminal domain-containing protein [Massilibacteroides sp.]MDD4514403.1 alpha-L-arabinofuranosidase C-terminal domain-containing protein [Massilibacteroides sp.]
MKKRIKPIFCLFLLLVVQTSLSTIRARVNEATSNPDSAYLFAYSLEENNGRSGLHFAWSIDEKNWHTIGPEYSFLKSDYGRWGSQKRMETPFLFEDTEGLWHCIWSLNNEDDAFAHATSVDLIQWGRQSYPIPGTGENCLNPFSVPEGDHIKIFWISDLNGKNKTYTCQTKDFKTYSTPKEIKQTNLPDRRTEISLAGNKQKGTIHKVNWDLIKNLIEKTKIEAYKQIIHNEKTIDDAVRFPDLQPVEASIRIDTSSGKKISELLIGAFFEDINYAADGGLYAELVQNRDFEYALSDKLGSDPDWNNYKAWTINREGIHFSIDTVQPIHPNNKHYALLNVSTVGAGLSNEGFDGIVLKAGENYDFSIFIRSLDNQKGKLKIRLTGNKGEVYGETITKTYSGNWQKIENVILAKQSAADARLEIIPLSQGVIAVDMVSLFPQKTFKNRKNGLRADLAQTIADIKPRFIRFPGGCVAHGDGLHNIYRWKNTIGPLETRTPMRNLWNYHQTLGLGYYEYFLFCEDIGAEPLPVLAAGVPCQNSGDGGAGQQCGIPMHEMEHYIQDILDLIEWANGDAKTTEWGKIRALSGHPAPFNLKYIGIGNEDLITDVFEERFTMIYNAIKTKHPEITVIGTVGPFYEGTDYEEGWKLADKLNLPMVDEHYYNPPGWFIYNQDFYDKYDRSKSKVYLGEYASHLPGRPNNLETALSEALYMTSLERNGDIVSMTSYAPLLAKEGHTQWNPDLIYFNNTEVKPTVGYYVQQLYGQNSGDIYYSQYTQLSNENEAVKKRIAVSVVKNSKTNELIIKIINMLPVSIKPSFHWNNEEISKNSTATVSLLTGQPEDKDLKPFVQKESTIDALAKELPPYSFKVIKFNL